MKQIIYDSGLSHKNASVANLAHFLGRTSSSSASAFRDADYAYSIEKFDAPNSAWKGAVVAVLALAALFYFGHANAQVQVIVPDPITGKASSTYTITNGTQPTSQLVVDKVTTIGASGITTSTVTATQLQTTGTSFNKDGILTNGTAINASGIVTNGAVSAQNVNGATGSFANNLNVGAASGLQVQVNPGNISVQNNVNGLSVQTTITPTSVSTGTVNAQNVNIDNSISATNIATTNLTVGNSVVNVNGNSVDLNQVNTNANKIASTQATVDALTTTVSNNAQVAASATAQVQTNLDATNQVVATQGGQIKNLQTTTGDISKKVAGITSTVVTDANGNTSTTTSIDNNGRLVVGTQKIFIESAGYQSANGNVATVDRITTDGAAGNTLVIGGTAAGENNGATIVKIDEKATLVATNAEIDNLKVKKAQISEAAIDNLSSTTATINTLNGRNVNEFFSTVDNHGQRINNLETRTTQLENRVAQNHITASKGIAGANAFSAIANPERGQVVNFGAGLGFYQGQSVLALGVAARVSKNTVLKASYNSAGGSAVGLNIGF